MEPTAAMGILEGRLQFVGTSGGSWDGTEGSEMPPIGFRLAQLHLGN